MKAHPFETVVTALAIAYFALALSPSSYGIGLRILGVTDTGTYLGSPRAERWDEWAVQTPYVQAIVRSGFASQNSSSFYEEPFRTIISLPVMDWGLIFRPLHWGYLFLPPAWSFSFYFAAAAALTIVGWVILLRRVGVTYLLAVAASLAIFFSPFTQAWWTGICVLSALFPWILLIFTSRARLRYLVAPCAWLVGSWLVSAAYLPGLVVLGFVGAAFLAAFVVRRDNLARLAILGAAALAGAAVGIVYLYPILRALSETAYPGHRVITGGNLPFTQWFGQFTPFGLTVGYQPLLADNLPESVALGSWFPALALAMVDYRRMLASAWWPLVVFVVAFVLLSCWQLASVFHWLGSLFLWDRAVESRSLLASGILLVVASAWATSRFPCKLTARRVAVFITLMAAATAVAAVLVGPGAGLRSSLGNARDNVLALASVGVLGLSLTAVGRRWSNQVGLMGLLAVLPVVVGWALYNPIQDSRPIFHPVRSSIVTALDRDAAARPDGAIAANFPGAILNGLGYRAVTHALPLPAVDRFAALFPGLDRQRLEALFNRYAEISVFDGIEPELAGEGLVRLPRADVSRFATVSDVAPRSFGL